MKLNQTKEKRNWEHFQSKAEDKGVNTPKSYQTQQCLIGLNRSSQNKTGNEVGDRVGSMSTNRELVASDNSLIQCTETSKNSQSGVSIGLNVPHCESSSII